MIKNNPYKVKAFGVTLVELMIGLVVMGIVITIAFPSLYKMIQRQQLENTANEFYANYQQARTWAITHQQNVYLIWRTGENWCYTFSADSACSCDSYCFVGSDRLYDMTNANAHISLSSVNTVSPIIIDYHHGQISLPAANPKGQFVFTNADQQKIVAKLFGHGNAHLCSDNVGGLAACS